MPLSPEQRQQLRRQCTLVIPDFATPTPAEEFVRMAAWCEAHGVEHDHYGNGALAADFERKIAALLGKPAAVFMPSGVMAQLAALRIHTEAARLPRFGLHPTSHLALHEEEAFSALLQCHAVPVGDRLRPMLAADLEAVRQPLACAIVELPIREAGGQLPTWEELQALHAAAHRRSMPLHLDGARLWECSAFYQRSPAEIAAGFESVYVSLYKGIGAVSGAMLAGSEDVIAQARLWRRRMGGTLYHLSPMLVSAAMRFDERLALMPALYQRALSLAAGLNAIPGLRVNPRVPQTNLLHLFFDAPPDAVLDARDALAMHDRCWLFGHVRAAEVPGWSATELYVGDRLLQADDASVLPLFAKLAAAFTATGGR